MKKLALLMAILMMVCASASAVTASDENVYPIADEVVTLTVWTGNVANRDYVNCDMTKFIEEKLGVKINFQFYTDDANTAYNLMLASDEWPDIFLGPWFSTDKILMGMEAKMLLPLNDLIETQGYNYKAVLEANPGYKDMLTAPDGNIYTFVYTDSGVHKDSEYKMFVKQSWLEKLGMEMPTTPEEFKDLLIAIKETDLNENGENDEIPLMGYYNGRKSDPICFLMNPFELYTDNYYTITDDGEIAFHANTDGWREGLKYIADLYANGLIAEETYVQDKTQFQAILNKPSDDAVIGVMPIWYQGDVIDANVLNWVDYEPIAPLKGDDGTQQSAARFGGNFNMVGAISTKCENPEIAFKFLDWFIGEEGTYVGHYGVEGKDWEWVDSKSFFGGDKSISRLVPDIEALWNSGSFPRADKAEIRYATTMDPEKIYTDNTYALVHAAQTYEPYYVNHHIPDVVWCTDEDVKTKVANYSTTINDYVKSTDTQFIMGQLDINDDEAWNAYLKGLSDRGLEDYLENLAVYYGLE